MIYAIVVERVLFPVPAKQYPHRTFFPIMSFTTFSLVYGRGVVRLCSSISASFNTYLRTNCVEIMSRYKTVEGVWRCADQIDGGRRSRYDKAVLSESLESTSFRRSVNGAHHQTSIASGKMTRIIETDSPSIPRKAPATPDWHKDGSYI